MTKPTHGLLAAGLVATFLIAPGVQADSDVALCSIQATTKWGTLGGITAYSIGTTSVNIGTTNLDWVQSNINHPVIGQNMFRIIDGRIEHIGQSWLKHSFCALQIDSNCTQINCSNLGGCLSFLAPGCQDPYSAPRNGSQSLLGPKWQVNASSGVFSYPAANGDQGASGNTTYMRLQVHNTDLGDSNAVYLVEGQYVTNDEAEGTGLQRNNASYRLVNIGSGPSYNISFIGGQGTEFTRAAIYAWIDHGLGQDQPDPDVVVQNVTVPGEGGFLIGYKVSDNGDGTWHYEYAVQNLYSDRSGSSFAVPQGAGSTISNLGFHDVDYHSGDGPGLSNYDGTDWPGVASGDACIWATTETYDENPSANALRWGTLYNYWFDADTPPVETVATIGLFKPGTPDSITKTVLGPGPVDAKPCPSDTNGDGTVDVTDMVNVILAWDTDDPAADVDGSGIVDVGDLVQVVLEWGDCP